jgi:hypothetical protein
MPFNLMPEYQDNTKIHQINMYNYFTFLVYYFYT